ncbi:MAG: PqqD family protein [Deltaproteobacteria bacterium]|nr:PqqD family protein [Deltaproteobacteria bacterium]
MERRYRVEPRVVFTELKDGTGLLLHLGTKLYFSLNRTGTFVWKLLTDAPRTRNEVAHAICEHYDASPEQVTKDLDALFEELISEKLVIPEGT